MVIWGACVNHQTFNSQKTLYHGKNTISIKRAKQKNVNKCFSLFFPSRQSFLKNKGIKLENKDNLLT